MAICFGHSQRQFLLNWSTCQAAWFAGLGRILKKELWYYFIKKIKDFLGFESHPGGAWGPFRYSARPFLRSAI
jgi:hypothetical protein